MADYSKWDNIADSSDEEESKREAQERDKRAAREEELEKHGQQRDQIDRWLKGHLTRMRRELGADPAVPELVKGVKPRWLSDEERKTMAMFIAVVHHDKYEINIARHHDIINIARQNRWLEEDPGTLELLCRVQRGLLKGSGNEKSMGMEDQRMEDMLISAINTLSAPSFAGCAGGYGGIYELFALIGDPKSEHAWDVRAKFMKKEYAADALFNSLLPSDGRPGLSASPSTREEYDMPSQGPGWACICFVILLLLSIAYIAYWSLRPSSVAVDDTPPSSHVGEAVLKRQAYLMPQRPLDEVMAISDRIQESSLREHNPDHEEGFAAFIGKRPPRFNPYDANMPYAKLAKELLPSKL